MRWKKAGQRCYEIRTPLTRAVMFSSPSGYLWAWAVYYGGLVHSGVTYSFQQAKQKAVERIEGIERLGERQ